jgi:two-component system phosphate regulon sensor histidine kinase PhoR
VALAGALLAATPWIAVTLEHYHVDTLVERLLAEARVVGESLPWTGGEALDRGCTRLATDLGVRLTVIARDGRVLGESTRSSESLENHAGRPEIRSAFATGVGQSVRHSATVGVRLLYVAWRQEQGKDLRVVRVALPLTTVEASVRHIRRVVLLGGVLATFLGLCAALILSRRMLRRIQRLVSFAGRLAAGESAPYLAPERPDDLGLLEAQLAEMARGVAATIAELRIERERLEAILRGMVEGVVVTDLAGRIVLMNARARALLGVPLGLDDQRRPFVELARDPALADLPRELASGAPTVTRDVTLGASGRALQVNAARLRGADGRPFGFVLVLHDVTELRRLEVMRRDFVANVSHELRTPLTAIKGYAETLLGVAGDDRETSRRFLAIIDRHSERLGRLIEDLLALSNLELGRTPLRLADLTIGPVIDDVLQILGPRAQRAGLDVVAEVAPGTPPVTADPDRFRQVLINLIENAIKYTPEGGHVRVHAAVAQDPAHAGMVEIAVIDTGIGVPAQDLPRLSERFFRVDKARSRELGGTGLGLAIVKHIMQAHGGALSIMSTIGHGTTVRVFMPIATGEPAQAQESR